MEKRTTGTVLDVKKQWWLKVNTKSFRAGTLDGAMFPNVIKVKYTVNGVEYVRNKWISPWVTPPAANAQVTVIYRQSRPSKFRLEAVGELLK